MLNLLKSFPGLKLVYPFTRGASSSARCLDAPAEGPRPKCKLKYVFLHRYSGGIELSEMPRSDSGGLKGEA